MKIFKNIYFCLCIVVLFLWFPTPMMRLSLTVWDENMFRSPKLHFSNKLLWDFACTPLLSNWCIECEKHREICVSYTYHIVSFELNESAFIILCTLFFMCDQAYVICISRTCIISVETICHACYILEMIKALGIHHGQMSICPEIYIISLPFCAYMFSLSFLRTINVYP